MNTAEKTQGFSWKTTGFWLVLVMAMLQTFYAIWAFTSPAEFAAYRGTPLVAGGEAEWVRIYASRTLFVALVLGILLVRREVTILTWVALIGIVMPASDAVLAYQSGASAPIVWRHVATIIYLGVAFVALDHWRKRGARVAPTNG
jgi:hypothetical protein